MLLRQTAARGRHNLLTTARLSQRRHDIRSSLPLRAYVTAAINRPVLFLRQNNSLIISAPATVSSCSSLLQQRQYARQRSYDFNSSMNQAALMSAAAIMTAGLGTAVVSAKNDDQICSCEAAIKEESEIKLTATSPQNSSNEEEEDEDNLPTYSLSQVANYNGQESPTNPHKRIWMSYGGLVYDVTEFIANHPGGSEKILMAAGGAIEPYWYCEFELLLSQCMMHFSSFTFIFH